MFLTWFVSRAALAPVANFRRKSLAATSPIVHFVVRDRRCSSHLSRAPTWRPKHVFVKKHNGIDFCDVRFPTFSKTFVWRELCTFLHDIRRLIDGNRENRSIRKMNGRSVPSGRTRGDAKNSGVRRTYVNFAVRFNDKRTENGENRRDVTKRDDIGV